MRIETEGVAKKDPAAFWDGWRVQCPSCGCVAVLDYTDKPKADPMWCGHRTITCPTPGCRGSFSLYQNGRETKNLSEPKEAKNGTV